MSVHRVITADIDEFQILFYSTANNQNNPLSNIIIPILFFCCWLYTIFKIYKHFNKYHQWTWILIFWSCLYEIFAIGIFWDKLFNKDIICCIIFILLINTLYIEYQHRLHHAFTALKHQQYVNKYITNIGNNGNNNYQWNKNCVFNFLFGQLFVVHPEIHNIKSQQSVTV